MAKNFCTLKINGKEYDPYASTRALYLAWQKVAGGIVQKVEFHGDIGSKRCAELLLAESQKLVPVETDISKEKDSHSNTGVFGSKAFKARVKELSFNYFKHQTRGEIIQFREKDGTYGAQQVMRRDKHGERVYAHKIGALKRSGRVDSLRDEKDHEHIIGYKVSYDTRRTDLRSLVTNFNYAIKQHDDWSLHHEVGQHNYLLRPLQELRSDFVNILREEEAKAFHKD